MKKIFLSLFFSIFLGVAFGQLSQFRIIGSGSWTTVNDSTFSSTVTIQADLTSNGFLPTGITDSMFIFTQTGQRYRISSATNLTFSSADLSIIERGGDWGVPVGQVMIYEDNERTAVPSIPFGATGATAKLQEAIVTYNSSIEDNISDGDKGEIVVSGGSWIIDNDVIDQANLKNNAVTNTKIANDAIDQTKIADGEVTPTEIENTTVVAGSYTNTNITVDEDGRVTAAASGAVVDGSETKITAGIAVTVSGTGTTGDPYVINSTSSGGGGASADTTIILSIAPNDTSVIWLDTIWGTDQIWQVKSYYQGEWTLGYKGVNYYDPLTGKSSNCYNYALGVGQSNMLGSGGALPGSTIIDSLVVGWDNTNNNWEIAHYNNTFGGDFNPLTEWAYWNAKEGGCLTRLVWIAEGGKKIEYFMSPDSVGYQRMFDETSVSGVNRYTDILFHQGESNYLDTDSLYRIYTDSMILIWRDTATWADSLTRIAFGGLYNGAGADVDAKNTILSEYGTNRDPYNTFVVSDGLESPLDSLHFSPTAMRDFGKRYYAELNALPYGLARVPAASNIFSGMDSGYLPYYKNGSEGFENSDIFFDGSSTGINTAFPNNGLTANYNTHLRGSFAIEDDSIAFYAEPYLYEGVAGRDGAYMRFINIDASNSVLTFGENSTTSYVNFTGDKRFSNTTYQTNGHTFRHLTSNQAIYSTYDQVYDNISNAGLRWYSPIIWESSATDPFVHSRADIRFNIDGNNDQTDRGVYIYHDQTKLLFSAEEDSTLKIGAVTFEGGVDLAGKDGYVQTYNSSSGRVELSATATAAHVQLAQVVTFNGNTNDRIDTISIDDSWNILSRPENFAVIDTTTGDWNADSLAVGKLIYLRSTTKRFRVSYSFSGEMLSTADVTWVGALKNGTPLNHSVKKIRFENISPRDYANTFIVELATNDTLDFRFLDDTGTAQTVYLYSWNISASEL